MVHQLERQSHAPAGMSEEEWQGIYRRAWDAYYDMDHLETLMRRATTVGRNPKRIMEIALEFYGCFKFEGVHPLQGGFIRRKVRTERRPLLPLENPLVFYPRRLWETVFTYGRLIAYAGKVWRLYRRVKREQKQAGTPYVDDAMRPLFERNEPGAAQESAGPMRQAVSS